MSNFFDKARRAINQLEVMVNTISMPKVKADEENLSMPLTDQSSSLVNKTVFISGGSRGIGFAIAKRCAQEGATVVIAAKTAEPHPILPGTIYTAADEINQAGKGKAIPVVLDIRDEAAIASAVEQVVTQTGGIDIVINNASSIHLQNMENTPSKRFDLMFSINVRGTYLLTQACLPYLRKSSNPHILTLSPPIDLSPQWFKNYGAYTSSKYGMSMMTMTFANELKEYGIAANSLWPKTTIATSAISHMKNGKKIMEHSRQPTIMADACYEVLTRDAKECTGRFFIDEEVLQHQGVTDFSEYACKPGASLQRDLFLS
ncbi:SDR family oxidoreductase [Photobacterium sp. DNB23_23_1]|uniref:NAD(P)-dependent oxidoreductase n=1 Tax=Photobacterium pectinilyticum TaxID=2906793 RepID=A0ABT1N1Y3_9GAMM|nr:NAD(P)-dependent oxidoreductase [Photobacterium sp. ZSDE20]MCQ1058747.1 NAD(P)-dependent oxidoreductase [Photobacterium sp. ZSDE20]MDD1823529.1 NAD(P)-dependent oxidoreductase [Photobacterium sp. ZSDE20]